MQLLAANEVAIERGERRLLAGVDLSVYSGVIWQLVGANGVGKTSLLALRWFNAVGGGG